MPLNTLFKHLLAGLLLVLLHASAFPSTPVEKYGIHEIVLKGKDGGNPDIDLELSATWSLTSPTVYLRGRRQKPDALTLAAAYFF